MFDTTKEVSNYFIQYAILYKGQRVCLKNGSEGFLAIHILFHFSFQNFPLFPFIFQVLNCA
jgi:hypothetical protein